MGGERWLLFSSKKQADAARAFLAPMREPEIQNDNSYGYISMGDDNGDCWLTWTSPCKLELGYSFGNHEANSAAADITARELAKRFKCKRLGSDSTGWYRESDWQSDKQGGAPDRYGPHENWIEWIEAWKPEWSFTVRMIQSKLDKGLFPADRAEFEEWRDDTLTRIRRVDAKIKAVFADLDAKAAS
jgi:hypothetical protein